MASRGRGRRSRSRQPPAPPALPSQAFLSALAAQRAAVTISSPPAPAPVAVLRGFIYDATTRRHYPRRRGPLVPVLPTPAVPATPLPPSPLHGSHLSATNALRAREGGLLQAPTFMRGLAARNVMRWRPVPIAAVDARGSSLTSGPLALLSSFGGDISMAVGSLSGSVCLACVRAQRSGPLKLRVGPPLPRSAVEAGPVVGLSPTPTDAAAAATNSVLAVARLGHMDAPGSLTLHRLAVPDWLCGSSLSHRFPSKTNAWGVSWLDSSRVLVPLSDARAQLLQVGESGKLCVAAQWRSVSARITSDVLLAGAAPSACGSSVALLGLRTGRVLSWDVRCVDAESVLPSACAAAPVSFIPLPAVSPWAVLCCDADASACTWDVRSGKAPLSKLAAYTNSARRSGVCVSGSLVAAVCADTRVRVWDVAACAQGVAQPLYTAPAALEQQRWGGVVFTLPSRDSPWPQLVVGDGDAGFVVHGSPT